MPELILSIPLALLILMACHEAGRVLQRWIFPDGFPGTALEVFIAQLAVGYVAVEFVITILASVHLLHQAVLWILLIGLAVPGIIYGQKSLIESLHGIRDFVSESSRPPLNTIFLVLIGIALAMDFILTCVPTTAWDSLTYHYPLPAIWLRAHGFIARPDICYSELPCASEMLFLLAFGTGGLNQHNMGIGHLAANHLTWATGAFACLALIAVTKRLGQRVICMDEKRQFFNSWTPGLLAAAAFLSLPIMYVEEMEGGYIENFIVYLSIALLIAMMIFKDTKIRNLPVYIGIIGGGLLASKHSNLFFDAIILIILIFWIQRSGERLRLWKPLGIAVLLAIVIPLPWYIKSFINTGDPFYPFLSQILRPDDKSLPEIMYWSNPNVQRSIMGFILYISRLSCDESLVQIKFRLLSWYFLPMFPFVIAWATREKRARTVGLLTWLLILIIYLLAPGEPRYMMAAWGLYAALGAWGIFAWADSLVKFPWIRAVILPILLVIPIAYSLVDRTQEVNNRVPTIIGTGTVEDYFNKSFDMWPLIKYINEETTPDAKVILADPRNFYVERDFIIWHPFPTPPTQDWAATDYAESLEVYEKWKQSGYDHLLLTYGPNYRAVAIASAQHTMGRVNSPLISDVPQWVFQRAQYAEKGTTINSDAIFSISGEQTEHRFKDFDVRSIETIDYLLGNEYLHPAFIDERAGYIFRISELGRDTE